VLISVVIPTYGHRDYVCETLASVFAQTCREYEIIVVNDGSPDDTRQVLDPFIKSGQIRYIEQQNGGQAAARNRGLQEAQGEFVAFLDDDDLWDPEALETHLNLLRSSPEAIVSVGAAVSFPVEGVATTRTVPISGNVRCEFLKGNWITTPGQTLIRRPAILEVGGFDPRFWGVDDWDLYLRLAAQNVGMEAGANIANSGSQPSDFGLATHIAAWIEPRVFHTSIAPAAKDDVGRAGPSGHRQVFRLICDQMTRPGE